MPDEHVLKMLDVNLLGAWRVTAAAIDALVECRGQVVLVGSRMAFLGLPLGAAYGVSKRGLTAYADALRAEYGTHVGVTCVHPAFIRTPIHERTRAAGPAARGLQPRGAARGVVAKLVAACEGDGRARRRGHPRRRAAARGRAAPAGLVDRVVARTLRKRVAAGELDEAPIAAGLGRRSGRA